MFARTRIRSIALVGAAAAVTGCFVIASAAAAGADAPPTKDQDQQTITFSYTGADQPWTVPPGVTTATFAAYGAQGAKEAFDGGWGGIATSSFAVTPGEVIHLEVGGMGLQKPPSDPAACIEAHPHAKPSVRSDGPEATASGQTGGWNGGGNGGENGYCGTAGGGGASDVRIGGSDLTDRVLVAGGGGGGSGNLIFEQAGGGGFPNGGSANGDGAGSGGDQYGHSGSGQLGQGSAGADPDVISGPGGGGGGGYYGGSGGQPGLAGGGGSSFGPPGSVYSNGAWTGNGKITVTFGGSAPTIASLTPNMGQAGSRIYINGTNLNNPVVTFGSTQAGQPVCEGPGQCWVAVPPGSGTVPVRILVNGEQTLPSGAAQFTYVNGPLTLSSISPQSASAGTVITLTGTAFIPEPNWTVVYFNGTKVNATCTSTTSCTAVVPDGLVLGSEPVKVVTMAGGTDPLQLTVLPGVTALSPAKGPAAGGTVVTVTGSGFSTTPGATTVTFGNQNATAVGCASSTKCTVVSPAGSGTVDVRVTVAGLQSPTSTADGFSYM